MTDGLDMWIPKENCEALFGLDRRIGSIRFERELKRGRFEGFKILWLNFKRFVQQRWRYYD